MLISRKQMGLKIIVLNKKDREVTCFHIYMKFKKKGHEDRKYVFKEEQTECLYHLIFKMH